MKTIRILALLTCVLLVSSLANARTVTVRDVLDHTDNGSGYFFLPPDVIMDHSPYFRCSLEDWDWTHSVKGRVPADANGIQGATLSIYAWDVDTEEGEIDVIYANGIQLGELTGMAVGQERTWTTTVFNLPSNVIQELRENGEVTIFMDIDRDTVGDRVNIGSSTLTVNYTATGDAPADPNVSVHRFWSPVLSAHFYTVSDQEKDMLISQYPDVWTYEGVAYRTFGDALDPDLRPVYRFWSGSAHFYTISEEERDTLINFFGYFWAYEGVAFYAYPEGLQPVGTVPVYRFWSGSTGKHFYTISEAEKQMLIDQFSFIWTLEGVAWYAYQ
jgi:hypothetical protein